jgi:hypothetical protein
MKESGGSAKDSFANATFRSDVFWGNFMRGSYWATLILLTMLVAPAKSLAQNEENIADIRCVAVAIRLAAMPAAEQKSSGLLMAIYYLGRLDGRAPNLDIEGIILEQISKMSQADYGAEATRCGKELAEKGQKITQLGQDLSQRGQQLQQTPAPTTN